MTRTRRPLKVFAATLLLSTFLLGPAAAPQEQAGLRMCPWNAHSGQVARCPRPGDLVSLPHRDVSRS